MLCKTFKTAKQLKISQAKYDTLVKVYWMFVDEKIPKRLFDMSTIGDPQLKGSKPCGTPGCILGWCLAVDTAFYEVTRLNSLFYDTEAVNANPTRAQAAQAIHNYLTTGAARWCEVLKTP